MKRNWPDEFGSLLDGAEEVTLTLSSPDSDHPKVTRKALKVRLSQQDYEKIWPLAEMRFRLQGERAGSAITLITSNPHYQHWHPADGGSEQRNLPSGMVHETKYVIVHFLLDEVREPVEA
ncbi:hypothetical protein ABUK73_13050 [Agrobacterium sp. BA1120]|uniref:hypothetical protein n=1 Tax=Agrobacterium sp. BA1120 TaxID=3228927 RepID=UPI00336A4852